jgi:hypothetical protein
MGQIRKFKRGEAPFGWVGMGRKTPKKESKKAAARRTPQPYKVWSPSDISVYY